MKFIVPEQVSYVTKVLQDAGFEAYIVGGCVRDLLLEKEPKDWDITTSAHPEQIEGLFEETYYNNDFGTVGVVSRETEDPKLKVIEVTPYRTESTYSDARRPDSVSFSDTLSDDLKRRDFTINALAFDNVKDILVDEFDGQKDIKDKLVRAVGNPQERFAEDALRILRAVRISAELGFSIEQKTLEALFETREQLTKISKERIRDEFTRIILSDRPAEALFLMKQCDLLRFVAPALEKTIGVDQNRSHQYTVFEHLVRSLQHAADKGYPLEVRLAALFHDISKPETRRFSREINDHTFYGHEVVGARVTRKALTDLRFSKEVIEKVVTLVRWHMFFSDPDKISLSAVRRMVANVGKELIWDLVNVRICDRIGSGRPKERPFRLRKYEAMIEEAMRSPISVSMLKIDGAKVMDVTRETPGPKIGFILHALFEEVLDDPQKNTQEYLKKRALELAKLDVTHLKGLGEKGRERKEVEDKAEVEKIRKQYGV